LSRSRKAQFFVLSAFTIVAIVFFLSQWIEPYTITDTSSIALKEEFFIFNNIKEKAVETVRNSKDCDELKYNLEEYKTFTENYAAMKVLELNVSYYNKTVCDDKKLETFFTIKLKSFSSYIESSFMVNRTGLFKE
jgi:hypothetical protein